ncbi:hypothetical protein GCM10022422_41500 [Flavobacterium ginsengisoli]|uniref:S9 family peptidase n=1 Tax=Flavobacterium ginsengisoli TaxID=871694 RepID=A0ABP7FZS9_9FLAO|nr:hypothetical protein [Flavobacterium ginsengisoli]
MKKLLLLSLLFSKSVLFSQTVLNSLPLSLNNLEKTQILNIEDKESKDIYAFVWDNQNINILKYNKSLFLTNQFTDLIKKEANRNLLGATISAGQKPTLYWISGNNKNILITTYNLAQKKSESLNFDFPRNHEYIINFFQENNTFYILAKEKELEHLLLYKFENQKCEIKMLDFSAFTFKNKQNVNISFNALLKYFPIKKIESGVLNPPNLTSQISKFYLADGRLIFTFDDRLERTQVFEVNLNTGIMKGRTFDRSVSKSPLRTVNSFYNDKKLFQIATNKDELLFEVKDFDTKNSIKKYSFSKNDTIPFKNSPFFLQINNKKPQQLKNTAKFLKDLDGLTPSISVIKNKKNSFITFSGFGESFDYYFKSDSPEEFGVREYYSINKIVYFDAMLNENLDFISDKQSEPMASENLFYYLNFNKKITLYHALELKNYYILSYYDDASKQFIMRKFTDGFMIENNRNSIISKSIFSNPATFEKISSY